MSGVSSVNDPGYPSLATICNLWRIKVGDQNSEIIQNGEQTICAPILNSAIRKLYRELRNIGDPTLIKDNVIIGPLTPVNSPTYGPGAPDPSVQVALSVVGYFDGVNQNGSLLLPGDIIALLRVWQQLADSNLPFLEVIEAVDGLAPVNQSPQTLGEWEYRGDTLYFNGSTISTNIRLRYQAAFPQFFAPDLHYNSTYVPIKDCEDAVAAQCAYQYDITQGSMSPEMIGTQLADYKEQLYQLRLTIVRSGQGKNSHRQQYNAGDSGAFGLY